MYPDLKTVLVGEFVDSLDEETRMVSAKEGSISAYKCQNGILDIKVKLKYNSPNFTYDPPAVARISNNVSNFYILLGRGSRNITHMHRYTMFSAHNSRSITKKKHLHQNWSFW